MHRWGFQRLFRWLIPAFILLVFLCGAVARKKAAGVGFAFLDDSAYANLTIARTIIDRQAYAMGPCDDMPAVHDVVWRLALALAGLISHNPASGSYLIGAICSFATMLMSLRLARFLFPFPRFIMYTSVLLILAPRLVQDALSGTSAPLATALATAACLFHIEGVSSRRTPLPMISAICVGLLMWIRIEFAILWLGFAPEPALGSLAERLREALKAGGVAFDDKPFAPHLTLARFREPVDLRRAACMAQAPVAFEVRELWLVFALHAVFLSLFRYRADNSPAFAITRAITGLLVLALWLLPLVAWNLQVVQVPWPQAVGAPFTLDTWLSATPGGVIRTYFAMVKSALPVAYGYLYGAPFVSGIFERILTWFGVIFIAGLSIWHDEERPYTLILFLMLLLPPLFALLYPYLGWQAVQPVFDSLSPLYVLAACFGIFRSPFLIERLHRKWKEGLPAPTGFNAWWAVMGSILLIVSAARTGSAMRGETVSLAAREKTRASVLETVKATQGEGKLFITDAPGWLTFVRRAKVVDLSGEGTPQVLTCLDSSGRLDRSKLEKFLAEQKPDGVVLWSPANDFVTGTVPCSPVTLGDGRATNRWPKICSINWYGVF